MTPELPDCDVCLNEHRYTKDGELMVYHVNGTKQHPETWSEMMHLAALAAQEQKRLQGFVPKLK